MLRGHHNRNSVDRAAHAVDRAVDKLENSLGMLPVGHGAEHGSSSGQTGSGAVRTTRYESLNQSSPQSSPQNRAAARMDGPAALAYPQRPSRLSGDSIELGTDELGGYTSDGMSNQSRKKLRPAGEATQSAPVTPRATTRAHFPEATVSRDASREREKPYTSAKGPAVPPLSRQSTGFSWANATATENKHPYGQLPSASRSDPNFLTFAEGDMPNSQLARSWLSLLAANIVVRWTVYIVPFLALLWIPGILGQTAAKDATVWSVKLLYWSIWLTIVWVGWWGCVAASWFAPTFLNSTVGVVAPELRHYILYISNVQRWVALWGWTLLIWITFNPLILSHGPSDDSVGDGHTLHQIVQGLFGIFVSACLLLIEKVIVQLIARNFHKKSYAERIQSQKAQIAILVQLYLYSHDIGRSDTLDHAYQQVDAAKVLKRALKGVRNVAKTGATALGTVASEIAGERVLQPNSPLSMVTSALQSANKSRQLARRIFFSYCARGRHELTVDDFAHCFTTRDEAVDAFNAFDQDGNGDISMEELEMSLLEIHRERLALASSMRDVDSAVARLDQILIAIWYFAAVLIIISLLNVGFSTLIAGAGTFVLGLSWMIGLTAQEILASCIFLFVKHPYDVSDRVDINGVSYVVMEMHLLYTVFRQLDGKTTQINHLVLNSLVIVNIRRSGPITENFKWDVDIATTFEQIESLRQDMLEFLESESRDFRAVMDIAVVNFEAQGKITLGADICYKSNWQNGTLKAQRRNKWIIALKENMFKHSMWGPDGAGNPHPDPADPTVVKLLRDQEAAPAYEHNRTSPPQASSSLQATSPRSPVSPSDRAPLSPAQLARGLSSRQGVVEDATTDIFQGRGRRSSIDVGSPRAQGLLSPLSSDMALPPSLLSVVTEAPMVPPVPPVPTTLPPALTTSRGGETRRAGEELEMKQRR